jgi:carbohydrate diacid regulator
MLKKTPSKNEIVSLITREIPNVVAITGGMGIDYGKEKRYYASAHKVAVSGKPLKVKGIFWEPFYLDPKTVIVCGIKGLERPQKEISVIEGLITQVRFEYFLREQTEKFIDPKSRFIRALLETDQVADFEQAIERGDILGVNLRSPQAVLTVSVPGYFKKIHQECKKRSDQELILCINRGCEKVFKSIGAGFKHYDQNIVGCIAPDKFAILKWADGEVNTLNTIKYFKEKAEYIRKIVEKTTGLEATAGAGQYYPGVAGLKKSYNDAEISLELGRKIWGEGKTYHIVDIGMLISLSEKISPERKAELAHQILGDILNDKDLHKTIRTFYEMNMSLTDAANKLHLHRNTLIYRLEKIKKEYGLDPRKFTDAVNIKLGLSLYSPEHKKCDERSIGKR